jgi:hypothetical protein
LFRDLLAYLRDMTSDNGDPEKVLYVTASPRGESSRSARLADAFLEAYADRREVEVDRLDAFRDLSPVARPKRRWR